MLSKLSRLRLLISNLIDYFNFILFLSLARLRHSNQMQQFAGYCCAVFQTLSVAHNNAAAVAAAQQQQPIHIPSVRARAPLNLCVCVCVILC